MKRKLVFLSMLVGGVKENLFPYSAEAISKSLRREGSHESCWAKHIRHVLELDRSFDLYARIEMRIKRVAEYLE